MDIECMKLGYFHFWNDEIENCQDVYLEIKSETNLISFVRKTKNCTCGHPCHIIPQNIALFKIEAIEEYFFEQKNIYIMEMNLSPGASEKKTILDIYEKYGDSGLMVILTGENLIYHSSIYYIEELHSILLKYNCPSSCHIRNKFFDKSYEKIMDLIENHKYFWKILGKNIWKNFSLNLLKTIDKFKYPIEFIKLLSEEYGMIEFVGLIEIYGDNFRIGMMSDMELSDCLGLPYIPCEKIDLHDRVLEAINDPKSILEKVIKWNNRELEHFVEGVFNAVEITPEIINTENLIGDAINEYPPGQIFRCFTSGGKIFQFTLDEVRNIIEKSSNPYTREYIDISGCFSQVVNRPKGHKTGIITEMLKSIVDPDTHP